MSTKAYIILYTIRETGTAIVLADNAREARRRFHDGEVESEGANHDGRVTGVISVHRDPSEDPK